VIALRPLALALAPVLITLAGASHAQASPVLPGYWDSNDTYQVLFTGGGHTKKCLTAEKIDSFVAAPSNSHYHCTYASQQISGGQASYRGGACYSKSGRKVLSDVAVDGRYEPEAFHLAFRFKLMVSAGGGIGLPGSAEITAHRISAECPADAK
jgi:hypothetical protein